MADLFDQVSASPAQPTGDIFDAVAKSTGPASVPYPANRWRDYFDRAEEEAGELYNSALAKAQSVNDVLAYPSEQVYQQLTHPSPGVNIENGPGVKTVSGLVAGAVDPRNIP